MAGLERLEESGKEINVLWMPVDRLPRLSAPQFTHCSSAEPASQRPRERERGDREGERERVAVAENRYSRFQRSAPRAPNCPIDPRRLCRPVITSSGHQ